MCLWWSQNWKYKCDCLLIINDDGSIFLDPSWRFTILNLWTWTHYPAQWAAFLTTIISIGALPVTPLVRTITVCICLLIFPVSSIDNNWYSLNCYFLKRYFSYHISRSAFVLSIWLCINKQYLSLNCISYGQDKTNA